MGWNWKSTLIKWIKRWRENKRKGVIVYTIGRPSLWTVLCWIWKKEADWADNYNTESQVWIETLEIENDFPMQKTYSHTLAHFSPHDGKESLTVVVCTHLRQQQWQHSSSEEPENGSKTLLPNLTMTKKRGTGKGRQATTTTSTSWHRFGKRNAHIDRSRYLLSGTMVRRGKIFQKRLQI